MNTIRNLTRTGRTFAGLLLIGLLSQSCVVGPNSWVVRTVEYAGSAAVVAAPLAVPGSQSLDLRQWHN